MTAKQQGIYTGASGAVARLIDACLDPIAPRMVLKRRRARAQSQAVLRYESARRDRLRTGGQSGSADGDLIADLPRMREDCRALVRDDAHASAMVKVLLDNVVGTGFGVQASARPETTGMSPDDCEAWNRACETLFADWSSEHADATERGNFVDLTRWAYRARIVEGDAFGHRLLIDEPHRPVMTAIEMIDADRVDTPSRLPAADYDIRGGVQLGTRSQPVAYWVRPISPDDLGRFKLGAGGSMNEPVPVARYASGFPNMVHLALRDRAGQTRGHPLLSPCQNLFDHLHHYLDSEVIAARANANIAMYIKRPIDTSDPDLSPIATLNPAGQSVQVYHETIEAGTIEYLNEGEEIQSFIPNRPGSNFEPFVIRLLRAIGACANVPYEMLAKDFARMNYSSARVLLLEARRGFEVEQQAMIHGWVGPWYRSVIKEALLMGGLEVPRGYQQNPKAFLAARYVSQSWGYVDPAKEIEASQAAIAANLSTPAHEAARNGFEVEEVVQSRARFMVYAREVEKQNKLPDGCLSGIAPKPTPPTPPPAGKQETTPPEEEAAAEEAAAA